VFGRRVVIGDGKFYTIQPVLVTYTIGKLPLHLRSVSYLCIFAQEQEITEEKVRRNFTKGTDISQKLKIPPKNRRYVAMPSNETEGIDVDSTSDSARQVAL